MLAKNHHHADSPAYVQDFNCLGAECPDTCCNGWTVSIDKQTHKKIRALPSDDKYHKIKTAFVVVPNGTLGDFARVKLTDKGCPLQTPQGLCGVHSDLGEEYLSTTCRVYPRIYIRLGDKNERYLTLSCPEAARLCLTDAKPWQLSTQDTGRPVGKKLGYAGGWSVGRAKLGVHSAGNLMATHEYIRQFAVDMVFAAKGSLWQRMVLLGLLCQKLDQLYDTDAGDKLAAQVEYLTLEARLAYSDGSFEAMSDKLLNIEGSELMQARFIQSLTQERLDLQGTLNATFVRCISSAFEGHEAVMNKRGDYGVFNSFDAQHHHMLKNFLANLLGTNGFPNFVQGSSLLTQWRGTMIKLAMVRSYLKGQAVLAGEQFGIQHYVDTVYSFSKTVEHNALFLPQVYGRLEKAGFDGIAPIAIMLR